MGTDCPECGDSFSTESGMKIHYGQVHEGSIKGEELSCEWCDSSFRKLECRISKDEHHTCSDGCRAKLVGELNSGENNARWKEPDMRTCRNCYNKFDYIQVRGSGVYCSQECKGEDYQERLRGENNPNYSDSSRREKFTDCERRQIFERDEYECQDCGQVGGQLQPHHIKRVSDKPELAHDLSNGVTLCLSCHAERHKGEPIHSAMLKKAE